MPTGKDILEHYADGVRAFKGLAHHSHAGPENVIELHYADDDTAKYPYDAWSVNGTGDLSDADLRGADLRGAEFWGVRWTAADLRGADFRKCTFGNCKFLGCDLRGAKFDGAELSNTQIKHLLWQDFPRTAAHTIKAIERQVSGDLKGTVRQIRLAGTDYNIIESRLENASFYLARVYSTRVSGHMRNTDLQFIGTNGVTEQYMSGMMLPPTGAKAWAFPLAGAIMTSDLASVMMGKHGADLWGVKVEI